MAEELRVSTSIEVIIMFTYQTRLHKEQIQALYLIVHYLWKYPTKWIVFNTSILKSNASAFQADSSSDWTKFFGT